MTANELKGLKDLPVPAPRGGAKEAAMRAALDTFDSASKENSAEAPKGLPRRARRTHTTSSRPWRRMMSFSRTTYATAASLAALALFIPAAVIYFDHSAERQQVTENGPIIGTFGMNSSDDASTAQRTASGEHAPIVVAAKPGADKDKSDTQFTNPSPPTPPQAKKSTPQDAKLVQEEAESAPANARITAQHELDLRDGLAAGHSSAGLTSLGGSNGFGANPSGRRMALDGMTSPHNQLNGFIANNAPADIVVPPPESRDRFDGAAPNPVKQVATEPVSTFSIDVDTSAYSFVRRSLTSGHLPPKEAVRVEELVNYFTYDYPRPQTATEPFKPTATVLPSPWNTERQLVHIGLKGYELSNPERPRANLVFLIDVSGSMSSPDKLALLKQGLLMLLDKLRPDDSVGIVTYASGSGVALEPTNLSEKAKIQNAIERLGAGGSTAGAQGIQDAYRLAEQAFDKDAVNRVILGTDGDFNVGITDQGQLKSFIEDKRKTGIYLSVLGFGQGNYNDALMQALAQNGNGTAAYIDTLSEARKVLIEEASSTLFPIARDVKIQIEFNPAVVSEYRLIGYETRALRREDFNNDKIDAGDVGSGHSVTAIYEVTPLGAEVKTVDNLRYQPNTGSLGVGLTRAAAPKPAAVETEDQPNTTLGSIGQERTPNTTLGSVGKKRTPNTTLEVNTAQARIEQESVEIKPEELAFLKLRYKLPKEDASKLLTLPVMKSRALGNIAAAPQDVRFAVAVAAFGQLLRSDPWVGQYSYDDIIALANGAKGADNYGLRAQFVELVRLAKALSNRR